MTIIRKWTRKDRSVSQYWPVSPIPTEWLYVPGDRRGISYAICCIADIAIGRITLRNICTEVPGHADIGVYLRRDYIGVGIGSQALRQFSESGLPGTHGIAALNALIHKENAASIRAFTKASYYYVNDATVNGQSFIIMRHI